MTNTFFNRLAGLGFVILAIASLSAFNPMQARAQPQPVTADDMKADLEVLKSLVLEAYGGRKLMSLKSISIESDRRISWQGTNYSPEFNEFVADKYHFQIDLKGQRGSTERFIQQNGNTFHDRTTTTPDGVAQISYPLNRVIYDADTDFFRRFGSVFRLSDTLLAHTFVTQPERATMVAPSFYRDRLYHSFSLTLPGSDVPLTVSVDAQSGYIMQTRRARGDREVIYLFRNHSKTSGISFARESQSFLNGRLFDYERDRQISINRVRSSVFDVEADLDVHIPSNQDEFSVNEITPNIHHVGRNISYSTFIQTDGYVIAAGSDGDFKARYEAFKQANPEAGSLRYLIIAHDHEFGRSGYKDALALGARLIVAKSNEAVATDEIGENTQAHVKFVERGDRMGPIEFFEIQTGHTHSLLLPYIRSQKLLLEDDHYRPRFEGVPVHLFESTISLVRKVQGLGLEVEFLVSSHGEKLEAWDTLESLSQTQDVQTCWRGRKICRSDM